MRVVKSLADIQKHIDKLEQDGWEVRLHHKQIEIPVAVHRHPDIYAYEPTWQTTMELVTPEHDGVSVIFEGTATCSPEDMFCKATGTRLAWQRAISTVSEEFGREALKEIFTQPEA